MEDRANRGELIMNLTIATSLRTTETTSRLEKIAPSRLLLNTAIEQGITSNHQEAAPCGHPYGRIAIYINQQRFVNESDVSQDLW
ncbi:MAG: hypothetical protein DF168_02247 [Candidatus Moanabacter tarae]|uniref:Uncharacterized protein n=1 Tax=Candidatus Moanibacter tarae TaxID=2200854 RepID=A0A2Z4AS77_9BACT|nr:MAG: hypothetical protein DF168_02247 [Candidatus Moanabacter tarae]